MVRHAVLLLAAASLAAAAAPLDAQTFGSSGGAGGALSGLLGSGGGSGASGLMSGLLPDIGATTKGNAAGLLGYCVRNKLLGQTGGVTSALGALTGGKGVTRSPGYAAGQDGRLVTGQGQSLSLDGLRGKVRSKVCDMVLQHAKSMIGR